MVAMTVWPTDGADGSVANEARWRKMGRLFAANGVAAGIANELAPTLAFPNLTIAAGAAWVDGHYAEITSAQTLTATANGLAVIRFDPAANTAELLWRDGATTPNQNPDGVWELPLAKTVGSALTDLRSFSNPAAPVTSFILDTVINITIPVNSANNMIPLGSFTMPFSGGFTYQGTLKIANATAGLTAVDPIEMSTTSTPPPTTKPTATWRVEAAPGAGQAITHLPLIAQWSFVAGNTVCTLRANIGVAGAVGLQMLRAQAVITCTRI